MPSSPGAAGAYLHFALFAARAGATDDHRSRARVSRGRPARAPSPHGRWRGDGLARAAPPSPGASRPGTAIPTATLLGSRRGDRDVAGGKVRWITGSRSERRRRTSLRLLDSERPWRGYPPRSSGSSTGRGNSSKSIRTSERMDTTLRSTGIRIRSRSVVQVVKRFEPDRDRGLLRDAGGQAATTAHFGSYRELGGAHEAVRAWCSEPGALTRGAVMGSVRRLGRESRKGADRSVLASALADPRSI